jgi:predicted RNA-binding protein (virulence factor B family)
VSRVKITDQDRSIELESDEWLLSDLIHTAKKALDHKSSYGTWLPYEDSSKPNPIPTEA